MSCTPGTRPKVVDGEIRGGVDAIKKMRRRMGNDAAFGAKIVVDFAETVLKGF